MYITDVDGLYLLGGTWAHNESAKGGALYVNKASRFYFSGQTIKDNTAWEGAGAYLSEIRGQHIKNIQFNGNRGRVGGNNRGAGLMVEACQDLSFLGLSFYHNYLDTTVAISEGGGLHIRSSVNVTIDSAKGRFEDNRAKDGGAVAVVNDGANYSESITFDGGTFMANNATERGGSIYAREVKGMNIKNNIFKAGSAQDGGALYLRNPGLLTTIDGAIFEDGKATRDAGAVMLAGRHPVFADGPSVLIKDATFSGNDAQAGNGGALMARNISYEVKFENTEFVDNSTNNFGGALALDGRTDRNARFIIEPGTKFIKNRSLREAGGGAVFAVFDPAFAVAPRPDPPLNRRLVFKNTLEDLRDNTSGTGVRGNFIAVDDRAVDSIVAPPLVALAAARFFQNFPLFPPNQPLLEYFIPYSDAPADAAQPWNQLKLNYGRSDVLIYAQ